MCDNTVRVVFSADAIQHGCSLFSVAVSECNGEVSSVVIRQCTCSVISKAMAQHSCSVFSVVVCADSGVFSTVL